MEGMLPWLATVCRTRREALPPQRRKQVHVAAAADVTQPTVARFEKRTAWPLKIDELVDAYARLTGTKARTIWRQAVHLGELHDAGKLPAADALDLDAVEEALRHAEEARHGR